jgi:hypothetical protein
MTEPIPPKIVAGSTFMRGVSYSSDLTPDLIIPHTWSSCDASSFQLRCGPNYKKNQKKAPSPPAFYELVGVE